MGKVQLTKEENRRPRHERVTVGSGKRSGALILRWIAPCEKDPHIGESARPGSREVCGGGGETWLKFEKIDHRASKGSRIEPRKMIISGGGRLLKKGSLDESWSSGKPD